MLSIIADSTQPMICLSSWLSGMQSSVFVLFISSCVSLSHKPFREIDYTNFMFLRFVGVAISQLQADFLASPLREEISHPSHNA